MKSAARFTAASAVMAVGFGLAGLGVATEAEAQPGPFPKWCPGDFWDRAGAPTGIGEPATTIGGDQDLTLIPTLTGDRDGDLVDHHPVGQVGPVGRDRTPTDLAGLVVRAGPAVTNSTGGAGRCRAASACNRRTPLRTAV